MADLIGRTITVQTLTAGGITRLQIFGGTSPNTFLVTDFEIPAADAANLAANLVSTPTYYVGNQTVNLAAANATNYTVVNSAGLVAGQQISIATDAATLPNTVLAITSVVNATTIKVTFVSGANAASVTSGDIFTVSSPASGTTPALTLYYPEAAAPLPGIYNAL
jgi:hypothetical protein